MRIHFGLSIYVDIRSYFFKQPDPVKTYTAQIREFAKQLQVEQCVHVSEASLVENARKVSTFWSSIQICKAPFYK